MFRFYSNDRDDSMPWQWTVKGFKRFAQKTFPALTDREHDLIAIGIHKWFYGEWS